MLKLRYLWATALLALGLGLTTSGAWAAFTLTDNGNNGHCGTDRQIKIVSDGQIELSFWAYMHGSIDHMYDLVNDPGRTTVMNDCVEPARHVITGEGNPFGVFGDVSYNVHHGYQDQCTGNWWPGMWEFSWEAAGQSSPVITMTVLEDNAVRKMVRMNAYWTGYGGLGVEQHYDVDRTITRDYAVYADGSIFVKNTDNLMTYPDVGTGGVSTFTLIGVTSSLDSFKLAGGVGASRFQGYDVPYGIAPLPWTLHFAHPSTYMNLFTSQYGDFSVPFSASGHYDTMWRHTLAAGLRFGWIANNNNSTPAGTSYTKYFYLQFGTQGSSKMPNFAIGSGAGANANFDLGDAYGNDYRTPATMSFSTGSQSGDGYDESQGVYTMNASGNVADLTFSVGSYTRYRPRFYVNNFTAASAVMKINGAPVDTSLYTQAKVGNLLLVHYFGNLTANSTLRFETATPGAPVANFTGNPTSGPAPLSVAFTDASSNTPTAWSWTFGDGNTSTAQNPSHSYGSNGSYTVALTATNSSGNNTNTKPNYIIVGNAPVANFSGTPTSGAAPLAVTFTDSSTNTPTAWSWTFGDGNTSTAQNPSHTYSSAGAYTVALKATNAYGNNTNTKNNYITAGAAPVANFSGTPTSGAAPLAVTFTDSSTNTPTAWSWNFGDSNTSAAQNPSHSYAAGTYTVALTATNAYGNNTNTKNNYITATSGGGGEVVYYCDNYQLGGTTIVSGSIADTYAADAVYMRMTCDPSSHTFHLRIFFRPNETAEQLSKLKIEYRLHVSRADTPTLKLEVCKAASGADPLWGPGLFSTTDQTVSWETTSPATYEFTDRWVIVDLCGCPTGGNTNNYDYYLDLARLTVTLLGGSAPVANFSGTPTSGAAPLAVTFTDSSTNTPTAWSWTFGDSNTSTVQNPSHTYSSAGSYTVALTATNGSGNNTNTKNNYITVGLAPVANFSGTPTIGAPPLAVTFTDSSTNAPTAWSWTFGDSNTSAAQNPSHTYNAVGTYTVALTATNAFGNNTNTKNNYITVGNKPVANFSGTPTSGAAPLAVSFTDSSTYSPTSWAWTFGDSNTSTAQNPSHTYSSAGTYTVALTATNAYGNNTNTKNNYVTAGNAPVANFSGTPTTGNAPLAVTFTDSSTNSPTAWSWTFGDSTSSAAQNPSHTYSSAGNYTVALTATNAYGNNTNTKNNYITVSSGGPSAPTFVAAGAVASGTGAITPALPGSLQTNDILLLFLETANEAISISNQNGGTWTQVTNSPQSVGTAAGSNGTRLTVFWSRYNGTQGAPTASDSGNHQLGRIIALRGAVTSGNPCDVTAGGTESTADTSGAIAGATTTVANDLVVAAIATSLPDASGTANFSAWTNADLSSVTERTDNTVTAGNGGGLGIATGVKATAGAYTTTAVTCATSSTKAMMSIAVKPPVAAAPVANFSGTPTIGAVPLAVTFTDTSTNTPTAWSWTFGDSTTSTAQNPSHTYSSAGTYTVALTATNAYGNNTNTKNNYITAGNPPVANFSGTPLNGTAPLSVTFTDSSTNSPTSWSWSFGDSTTSTAQNPSHSYAAGTYTVALTATNAFGNNTNTKNNYVTAGSAPVANFSGTPLSGNAPLSVTFTDSSTNSPTAWSWSFGDATTSTAQNPSHSYAAGTYTVALTATNAYGNNTNTKNNYVTATSGGGTVYKYPTSWTYPNGKWVTLISGSLTDLQAQDGNYMVIQCDTTPGHFWYACRYTVPTGYTPSQVASIAVDYVAKCDQSTTPAAGSWCGVLQSDGSTWAVTAQDWTPGLTDTTMHWSTNSPAGYMQADGSVQFQFCGCPNGSATYNISSNLMRVTLTLN